ncbi:hypothetical protein CIPAW_05G132500 [Carya illinoinensis]|uniref:Uncharacterized protein n=1 Tax=Carya illinoinensis TaxID=32201 RepID=A0A8T1QIU0_CARIL|nr:hypothetical protein CIPAW_05G132500 [Carya illinoinensis]KAG6654252.1 hypothetical protein CIPAW_05G132500 [Carya illinoinensis]KAG6654253.1 hypothetical protein CIPAW_05G132500 [Carya illinoinensis]
MRMHANKYHRSRSPWTSFFQFYQREHQSLPSNLISSLLQNKASSQNNIYAWRFFFFFFFFFLILIFSPL